MKRRLSSHQLNEGFAQLYYGLVTVLSHIRQEMPEIPVFVYITEMLSTGQHV